jgi:hypothetical protein
MQWRENTTMNENTTTRPSRCDGSAPIEEPIAALQHAVLAECEAGFADRLPFMTPEQEWTARTRAVTDQACELEWRQGLNTRVHNHHTAQALIDRML